MSHETGLRCLRCGAAADNPQSFEGCPVCQAEGSPSNFQVRYDFTALRTSLKLKGTALLGELSDRSAQGMWRYQRLLPLRDASAKVSLGEGATPLLHIGRTGERLGLPRLYAKDESRNPTWSYKDRLSSVLVSKGLEWGVKGVLVSSTGNHGAAVAAYAARAGLPCVVFTVASVPATMKTLMLSYGAMVVALNEPRHRWTLMRECAHSLGWMPASGYVTPPVGSPAYGVEGYKTIAFEIVEQLGRAPDWVIVPTAYGDGLFGTWKGFSDLKELGVIASVPRMVAAEPFGSLSESLAAGADEIVPVPVEPSVSFSIAIPQATFQGLVALRQSDGTAVVTPDDDVMEMQINLAAAEGIYAEASSVAALVAAKGLRQSGVMKEEDDVAVVLSSTGLKDPATTGRQFSDVPVVEPEIPHLRASLRSNYGFDLP